MITPMIIGKSIARIISTPKSMSHIPHKLAQFMQSIRLVVYPVHNPALFASSYRESSVVRRLPQYRMVTHTSSWYNLPSSQQSHTEMKEHASPIHQNHHVISSLPAFRCAASGRRKTRHRHTGRIGRNPAQVRRGHNTLYRILRR